MKTKMSNYNGLFKSLSRNSKQHLLHLADQVKDVEPIDRSSIRINTAQLNPNTKPHVILEPLSKWIRRKCPYLYYLRVVNNPELAEVKSVYIRAKAEKKMVGHIHVSLRNRRSFTW